MHMPAIGQIKKTADKGVISPATVLKVFINMCLSKPDFKTCTKISQSSSSPYLWIVDAISLL